MSFQHELQGTGSEDSILWSFRRYDLGELYEVMF